MYSRLFAGTALALALAAAPAVAAAQDEQPVSVSELVVTAEKAGRTLQETPTSVAIVTGQQIENEALTDIYDVYDQVPNLNARFGASGFTIRGIDAFNIAIGGQAGLASLYLDGVPLPRRAIEAGPLQIWDVQQIEVLRGPQSTLQGRNALAGAIYINTQRPTFDWTGRARAIIKDGDRKEFAVALGGPIVDDQLAFRLSVEDVDADGFVYNPVRRQRSYGEAARNYRAALRFEPAAAPRVSVLATYLDSTRTQGEERSTLNTPDFWDDRINPSDALGRLDTKTRVGSLQATFDASESVDVTAVLGWVRSAYDAMADVDLTSAPLSTATFHRLEETYTGELRANFDFGRLTGVAGLYTSDTDTVDQGASRTQQSLASSGIAQQLTAPPFNLSPTMAAAVISLYPASIPLDSTQDTPSRTRTYAGFADASFDLSERLSLLGGFRLEREEQKRSAVTTAALAGALPNPLAFPNPTRTIVAGVNNAINAEVARANGVQAPTTSENDAALPKIGLRYAWSDDLSASFVVQRGYRSGGSATNYARSRVVAYDPEYAWNYELALRSRFRDGRMVVNANAFYMDWTDQQVPLQLSGNIYDVETVNAGSSHLYGFEVEMNHRVSDAFSYYASAGSVVTRFDDFVYEGVDLAGNEFANAPRYSAAVGMTWRFEPGLFLDINANYKSAAFDDISPALGQTVREVDARTLVNFKAGWELDRVGFYLTGQNIFDEHYILSLDNTPGQGAVLGQPRVLGVSIEARW